MLESEVEIRTGGLVATLSPEDQAEIVMGFIWIVRGQASRPTVTSLRFLERSGPRERTAEEDERVRRRSKQGRLSIVSQCASFTIAAPCAGAEQIQARTGLDAVHAVDGVQGGLRSELRAGSTRLRRAAMVEGTFLRASVEHALPTEGPLRR